MKKLENNALANHYINGHWIRGEGPLFASTNPADGSVIWQGNEATRDEVRAAVDAAHLAFPDWACLELSKRLHYLERFASDVEKKQQELAYLIALETGKPLWEALTEVNAVVSKVKLSIQAYHERTSEKQFKTGEATAHLRYKPHGVVAVLGAFNFPAHLSNGHIVPALLAGNTVVYKASELAPAVAQFIVQCWHESGLPQGVFNCVQGGVQSGQALLGCNLQGVYFTGSYRVGQSIHQQFGDRPEVILALEMGGNNPLIVDSVKNNDAAVYSMVLSTLLTSGQRCSCARRVFIRNDAKGDALLSTFIHACQAIQVGPFTQKPEPFMGPIIHYEHALKHLNTQRQLIEMGGEALLTMRSLQDNTGFLSPGILDMTRVANAPDEEIFAPLIQIYRFDVFEDALLKANKTRYGLVAGLLSDDRQQYELFYRTIRAGLINWNRPTTGALSSLPFGGVGASGNHRPSAYFAADYCAYPIASVEQTDLVLPTERLPGLQMGV